MLLLRAYRLAEPATIAYRAEYGGCRSWIDLAEPVSLAGMTPALGDGEYAEHVAAIREIVDRELVQTI